MPSRIRPSGARPSHTRPVDPAPPRTRPIRVTLTALLVIPLISLVALWGYSGYITLGPAIQEHNYNTEYDVSGAKLLVLQLQLGQERLQSYIWLSSGGRAPKAQLDSQRKVTNGAEIANQQATAKAWGAIYPEARQKMLGVYAQLKTLPTLRAKIDTGTISPLAALQGYNSILSAIYAQDEAAINIPDPTLYRESYGALQASEVIELASQEAALLSGGFASGGRLSRSARELFVQCVAQQHYANSQAIQAMSPSPGLQATWAAATNTSAYSQFAWMENQIVGTQHAGASTPIPFSPTAFQQVSEASIGKFATSLNAVGVVLASRGHTLGDQQLFRLALAGGVGLLAVLASIFLLVWFSRRITRELTGLRDAARTMANERLPRIVDRLRLGEDVDVGAESPPIATGRTAEVAAVAQALGSVQWTAAEAAVGQAELRKGISQVFLNLARRNQTLLHRQLSTLDGMERRTSEPEALEELFRLDHLTTRMRRYAESLIILSGNLPGRGWSKPVPAVDVLRAAVAEVEDYTRVEVACDADDVVVGASVADVIHMLAELVENATAFSPPSTRVTVRGERVGRGFAIEIEDRGLGIETERLQALNQQVASRPEFDLAKSDQLGLFVVGQLASRHGIRVSLRANPFGGATAIVLIPNSVMATEEDFTPPSADTDDGHTSAGQADDSGNSAEVPAMAGLDAGSLPERTRIPGRHRTGPGNGAPDPSPSLSQAAYAAVGWDMPGLGPDEPPHDRSHSSPPPGQPAGQAGGWSAASAPGQPPAPSGPPAPPEPPSGPPGGPVPSGEAGMYMGLPRRQRQANMAPQLRDRRSPAPSEAPTDPAGTPVSRSPEDVRSLMTSVYQGWQRGRVEPPPSFEMPPWELDTPWPGQNGLRASTAGDWPTGSGSTASPGDTEGGDN